MLWVFTHRRWIASDLLQMEMPAPVKRERTWSCYSDSDWVVPCEGNVNVLTRILPTDPRNERWSALNREVIVGAEPVAGRLRKGKVKKIDSQLTHIGALPSDLNGTNWTSWKGLRVVRVHKVSVVELSRRAARLSHCNRCNARMKDLKTFLGWKYSPIQHEACLVLAALHALVPVEVPPRSLHWPVNTQVPIKEFDPMQTSCANLPSV